MVSQYYSQAADGSPDGASLTMFYGPAGMMKTIYRTAAGGEEIRFQHLDYKGTLRNQSDANGLPIGGQNLYYPYGEVLQQGTSATHRRYFQTGESDHTGFVHMGARYYDPTIGRFLSPDPIDASVSAYTFASGNPIMFFDPSGLITIAAAEGRPTFNLPLEPLEPTARALAIGDCSAFSERQF